MLASSMFHNACWSRQIAKDGVVCKHNRIWFVRSCNSCLNLRPLCKRAPLLRIGRVPQLRQSLCRLDAVRLLLPTRSIIVFFSCIINSCLLSRSHWSLSLFCLYLSKQKRNITDGISGVLITFTALSRLKYGWLCFRFCREARKIWYFLMFFFIFQNIWTEC